MPIVLSWLDAACLLGAVQGVLLAVVLATKRTNRTANRLLAILMATFSVYLFSAVYYALHWVEAFPHFFGLSYPLPLVFGPLVYLYAVYASDRRRAFRRRDLLHFLPLALVIVATLPIYLESGAGKVALYRRLMEGGVPVLFRVVDWTKYVSGVSYTVATIRHLLRHRAVIKLSYSAIEHVNLRWLLWLSWAAAVIWSVATALQINEVLRHTARPGGGIVAPLIAILVYGIGYLGLRQPEIFDFAAEEDEPRYERSGLGDAEAESLRKALLQMMERDRPFQDSQLTLVDLARRLDTTPHKLSEVLSRRIGLTFYDFVNGYRVEDVRRRVADGHAEKLTLLALALDAGFASKSTFNNVFKKQTGKTPSEYRRALAS